MSVGGRVIEVIAVSADKVWVNTDDAPTGYRPNPCAVYVHPAGQDIQVGDSLWWQGREAYWTPQGRPFGVSDISLEKIGFSGVRRPDGSSHE
jgi:hypothetical protein